MSKDHVIRWYQTPALSEHKTQDLTQRIKAIHPAVSSIQTEHCIYAQIRGKF